jgi:hypothetical protein
MTTPNLDDLEVAEMIHNPVLGWSLFLWNRKTGRVAIFRSDIGLGEILELNEQTFDSAEEAGIALDLMMRDNQIGVPVQ